MQGYVQGEIRQVRAILKKNAVQSTAKRFDRINLITRPTRK